MGVAEIVERLLDDGHGLGHRAERVPDPFPFLVRQSGSIAVERFLQGAVVQDGPVVQPLL